MIESVQVPGPHVQWTLSTLFYRHLTGNALDVALCLASDSCRGVRGDLLVIDSHSEDQTERSLPAITR